MWGFNVYENESQINYDYNIGPISVTSHTAKLIESVVSTQIIYIIILYIFVDTVKNLGLTVEDDLNSAGVVMFYSYVKPRNIKSISLKV